MASLSASTQKSASSVFEMRHASTLRVYQSMTAPSPFATVVPGAARNLLQAQRLVAKFPDPDIHLGSTTVDNAVPWSNDREAKEPLARMALSE
jgi:hypothetical protein